MQKKTYAKLVLLLTSMLWGTTFTLGKLTTDVFSVSFVIAFRFTLASIVLLFAAFPLRKQINKHYLSGGFWMGFTLFISYVFQIGGIALNSSPGKSAFLCTTYTVLVPFIYWIATKERPQLRHVICVFLCFLGIGILSLQSDGGMLIGDIFVVLSGVPCAVNIVISSILCRDKNPLLLTVIEMWAVAILSWIVVLFTDTFPKDFPINTMGSLIYLGLIATALCLYLQSFGLKYAEASIGGMLLSLESVFGVLFSILIFHEQITTRMMIGFFVIFTAILLAQYEKEETKKQETTA